MCIGKYQKLVNKKILITGGAGYIGIELTLKLLNIGCDVTCLDSLVVGTQPEIINDNYTFILGDVRDKILLAEILKQFDIIIHLAFLSNDPSYKVAREVGLDFNYEPLKFIFDKMCQIERKQTLLFPSSCSIYGNSNLEFVTERTKPNPQTEYSITKILCENYLFRGNSSDTVDVIIPRPATVYGASMNPRLDLLVNRLIHESLSEEKITLDSSKYAIRPTVYIKSLIEIYMCLLSREVTNEEPFVCNIAFDSFSIKELANKITNATGTYIVENNNISIDVRSYKVISERLHFLNVSQISNIDENLDVTIDFIKQLMSKKTFRYKDYTNIYRQNKRLMLTR